MFELGTLFSKLFDMARALGVEQGCPTWLVSIIIMAIKAGVLIGLVCLMTMVLVFAERKVSAWMQARIGPRHTGPWGLLQTFADSIKLLFKEDILPRDADRLLHRIAPMVACAPVFVCFAPVPFGTGLTLIDLDTSVLFIFAMSGISTLGILIGGWGSGNKFSMIGGVRAVAQLVSYEIPRVLSVVPVLMFYGTQSLRSIAMAQDSRWFDVVPRWFIFYPVIGQIAFLIFLIASVAETNRTPFDLPEAESELVSGFHTEYSGIKFAMFFLSEYAYVFLSSAMATALFLGGGDGVGTHGIIPSWFWFLGKTFAIVFLFLWFRWTYPRLRIDRLMQFCWQFLLPWSLVNIGLTGAWILWRH